MSGDRKTGYKNPPVKHQFAKGKSGNPRGRPPREARAYLPTQIVRDILAITEEERTIRTPKGAKKVPTIALVIRRLVQRALEGHGPSMRYVMQSHEKALEAHQQRFYEHYKFIEMVEYDAIVSPVHPDNARSHQKFINALRKTTRKT